MRALPIRFLLPAVLAVAAAFPPSLAGQEGEAQTPPPPTYRARHILITWKDSPAATPETKFTKEEALAKAKEIVERLKKGEDFATIAAAESVCPSKADGGYLGQFQGGRMVPAFEEAVKNTPEGEVVGPVETQFGYHVIQRMKIEHVWPERIAASHILIAYKEAMRSVVDRSKEEAKALADKIWTEIQAGKITFEDAAKQHSDDKMSGERGGDLGTRPPGGFTPTLTDAIVAMQPGTMRKPVETAFGFHILRREQVVEPMRASHILIPWKGTPAAPGDVTRSKEEALKLATEIFERAKKGEDFSELAKQYSTCPSKGRGGDLGPFEKGQMVEPFEKAVAAAKTGDVVGPVETQFGYHIIMRTK